MIVVLLTQQDVDICAWRDALYRHRGFVSGIAPGSKVSATCEVVECSSCLSGPDPTLLDDFGLARTGSTQIDVSSDDDPLIMRSRSGRVVVPRMGERDPEESRNNQVVDVAFGQPSAIVVGPQDLEPVSTVPAASGEFREERRAFFPDSAKPTLIDMSTRSEHDGDRIRGYRFVVVSSGSDTESGRPTHRGEDVCELCAHRDRVGDVARCFACKRSEVSRGSG